jgi:hypothetical protein
MNDYYRFALSTSAGTTKSVRVTSPNLSLTPAAIHAAAEGFVGSDVFLLKEGHLTDVKKAQRVTVSRTKLF